MDMTKNVCNNVRYILYNTENVDRGSRQARKERIAVVKA